MFALSSRFGALADRLGPRWFVGGGPLIAGAGMLMLLGFGGRVDYLRPVASATAACVSRRGTGGSAVSLRRRVRELLRPGSGAPG
jgi:hypothetical protein